MKELKIKKMLLLSQKNIDMVNELGELEGFDNFTTNVRNCINFSYAKKIAPPTYASGKMLSDPEAITKRNIAKAVAKENTEEAMKNAKRQIQVDYCEKVMHGKVDGNTCSFRQWGPTSSGSNDSTEKYPLGMMGTDILESHRFYPNEAVVMENREGINQLLKEKL